MLTDHVRKANAEAARFVHWGTTSQDVADTAMSLLLKRAEPILMADLLRLEKALAALSESHKESVMLGRTLLQPAPPVTFGLKAAGWLASVRRGQAAFAKGISRRGGVAVWRSQRHVGVARRPRNCGSCRR